MTLSRLARRRTLSLLSAAVLGLPVLALPAGTALGAEPPLPVVASFSILGDIVREVGGPNVNVDVLVGPDGDAHSYEPTPQDAKRLSTARVLVVNGLDFEAWLPRLTQSSGFPGQTIVASTGVTPRPFDSGAHEHDGEHHDHDAHDKHDKHDGHDHDDGQGDKHADDHASQHRHGANDPHAWQDLANGVRYARNIGAGLAAADPTHAAAYRARAAAYIARLETLNAQIKAQFEAIPATRRKVVTSHDAFGYFGQAYGIRFLAPVGMSTDAEPSAADMARLIKQVKRDNIRAVFVENISSPRLIEQIARETSARAGGTLYSDALSKSGQPGATYIGMFEWNAKQIVNALQP